MGPVPEITPGGTSSRVSLSRECAGACGDLGTFIPHVIAAMTIAGLAPAGVLFGFGASFIAAGIFYGLPMAVQPMKAISAVLITGQLTPAATAAAGLMIGAILLFLGVTGLITRVSRIIPQSVTAGLQLGLGLMMGWLGLMMVLQTPWIGIPALMLLFGVPWLWPWVPIAPLVVLAATGAGFASGVTQAPSIPDFALYLPPLVMPANWSAFWQGLELAVVPQLPLTLTNAVIVTAVLCQELFPGRAARATVRNLALTSGAANFLLAPFGAMPMCHGAGGVTAQHRNEPLTKTDLAELERIFTEAGVGSPDEIERIRSEGGLGLFVRSLVGLDRAAAKRAFDGFIQGRMLTAHQLEFIDMMIDHLTERGAMDPRLLYESPFTDIDPLGVAGVFKEGEVMQLVQILRDVEGSAAA
jgi:hypothetical protein